MVDLFLSSVSRELEAIRKEIVAQLLKSKFTVANMENFGARPDPPLEVCLAEVRKCNAAIVIVGPRYGSLTPAGDVSFTHEEYREAQRRGLKVLAFVLSPSPELPEAELQRLEGFKDEVGRAHKYENSSSERLCSDILATLHQREKAGTLGRRFSFFQEYERFFERELDTSSLFNHGHPLVGRDDTLGQIISFVGSEKKVLILSAPGGAGKSRLLLEAAIRLVREPSLPTMRFVVSDVVRCVYSAHPEPTMFTPVLSNPNHNSRLIPERASNR